MMQHPSGEVSVPTDEPKGAIEELFTYHAPSGDQPERYKRIREAAKALAYEIDRRWKWATTKPRGRRRGRRSSTSRGVR